MIRFSRSLLRVGLWACLGVFTVTSMAVEGNGRVESVYINRLDKILLDAGGVRAFLRNPQARDEYYNTWLAYVGNDRSRFPRRGYETILQQIDAHLDLIPSLEARLMEEEESAPDLSFEVTGLKGKAINESVYREFFLSWLGVLFGNSLQLGEQIFQNPQAMEKLCLDFFEKWHAEDERFEKTLTGKTRRQRDEAYAEYAKTIRQDSEREGVAASLLLSYVWNGLLRDSQWGAGVNRQLTPYLMLSSLLELQKNPAKIIEAFSASKKLKKVPMGLKNMLRDALPTFQALEDWSDPQGHKLLVAAAEKGPDKTNSSFIRVVSLRRGFHRSFKGLPLKECIGGLDEGEHLANCTIERWGTGLIKSSWFHVIELGQRFGGYIHHIPVEVNGQKVVSVDLMSNHLIQRISHLDEESNTFFSEPLILTILRRFKEKFPREWTGVALSDSSYNDHASVLDSIKQMSIYDQASKAGFLMPKVEVVDHDLENEISKHWTGPSSYQKYTHGQRMIFNATNKDAKSLRLLEIPAEAAVVDLASNKLPLSISVTGVPSSFVSELSEYFKKSADFQSNAQLLEKLQGLEVLRLQAIVAEQRQEERVHREPPKDTSNRFLFQHAVGTGLALVAGRALGLVPATTDFWEYMLLGGIVSFVGRVVLSSSYLAATRFRQNPNAGSIRRWIDKFTYKEQHNPLKYVVLPAIPLSLATFHCAHFLMKAMSH